MSTKTIQIPSTCAVLPATLSKTDNGFPNSVNWRANGHNTYTITLPTGYFEDHMIPPDGEGTFAIATEPGGYSPTLTLDQNAPTNVTIVTKISGANCKSDSEGNPADILVDP